MKREEFEKLVSKALLILPKKIRQKMENVAICIEKRPSEEQLRKTGLRHSGLLLGLYEGSPQTFWGKGFGGNLPDKITIFQESIENFATRPEEIKELIKNVVWHEVAHHFGFSERGVKLLEQRRGLKQKVEVIIRK
ncbi:metallopeptidase family protein [Patescibacteria group bacterium]|nr:metallopeptidase family protein [Patescibacteria group bacterium]